MKKKFSLAFSAMLPFIFSAFLGIDAAMALMIEMGTPELTARAEAIVRGKVKDLKSEWDGNRKFIWTLVTISVSKSMKGKSPVDQDIIVKIPGGVVGEIGQETEDTPIFIKGEDVLLFLTPEVYKGEKVFRVTGKFQGKYTIKDDMVIEKKIPVETFLNQVNREKQKLLE